MWGVGIGKFNRQHFFTQADGVWTALCGMWMRPTPTPSKLPTCFWCAAKKREQEMKRAQT